MPSVLSAAHFHSEEAAYRFVEARLWANGRPCPHCGVVDKSGPLKGNSTRIGVYKCYACRKPFTVKVGTVFESSHVKLHVWLQAMHLMASSKKGVSTNQLHRILGVSLQTAWFLSHRIREAMTDLGFSDDSGPLGGEGKFVESDETFIGGKARNRAYKAPAPKKRLSPWSNAKVASVRIMSRKLMPRTCARSLKLGLTKPRISGPMKAAFTGRSASNSPAITP
jgi:transposase-like protein